ncbi:MAG: hypothetical protein R2863_12100 [Candidatus Kapaibacterium sp.]|nr:hypothetical protein [Romboutsia sp.]
MIKLSITIFIILVFTSTNYTIGKVNYKSKVDKKVTYSRKNGNISKIEYLENKAQVSDLKKDSEKKEKNVEIIDLNEKKRKLKEKKFKKITEDERLIHGDVEYFKLKRGKKVFTKRIQYKYGMKNGQTEEYYPNGKIKKIENYLNSELDGYVITYDIEGNEIEKLYYKKGILIKTFKI